MQINVLYPRSAEAALRVNRSDTYGKAAKAAREFEGVLLSNLLSQLQTTFQVPGTESEDPSGDSIRGIGLQELGEVWAKSGGIGLGRMILEHIAPPRNTEPSL
jgi:hypothetical protein